MVRIVSKNALTCNCGKVFDNMYQKQKHRKETNAIICSHNKKRGPMLSEKAIRRENAAQRKKRLKKERYVHDPVKEKARQKRVRIKQMPKKKMKKFFRYTQVQTKSDRELNAIFNLSTVQDTLGSGELPHHSRRCVRSFLRETDIDEDLEQHAFDKA